MNILMAKPLKSNNEAKSEKEKENTAKSVKTVVISFVACGPFAEITKTSRATRSVKTTKIAIATRIDRRIPLEAAPSPEYKNDSWRIEEDAGSSIFCISTDLSST